MSKDGTFALLLERLLPHGGLAVVLEAWLDESGIDSGSPTTFVGGYVFTPEKAKGFIDAWDAALPSHLRPFRTSAFWRRQPPFDQLPRDERLPLLARLIPIVRDWSETAVCVCVDNATFASAIEHPTVKAHVGSAYSLCVAGCLSLIQDHCAQKGYTGEVAYFFESGAPNEVEAADMLHQIMTVPELREHYRYAAHGFVPKSKPSPLPAADMLVWSWQYSYKHSTEPWFGPVYDLFHQYPMRFQEYTKIPITLQAFHNLSWGIRSRLPR